MINTTLGKIAQLRDEVGPRGTVVRQGPLSKLSSAGDQTPFAARFLISRFLKVVLTELRTYEETALKLGQKYGHPSPEHDNKIVVDGPNLETYRAELRALDDVAITLPVPPLPVATLEHAGLTPRDLLLLEDFITPPETPVLPPTSS